MQINKWKIFDKSGSNLGWTPDSLIKLIFESPTGKGAEGFLITDSSGLVVDTEITNGGYLYDNDDITLSYVYSLENESVILTPADASILFTDVSIFNPELINTKSISDLALSLDASFVYPSVTYASAIFLNPISQGLIETEHIYIFEETSIGYIRPYDASNFLLVFEFIGDNDEIKFFEVDDAKSEIIWSDSLVFDTSILISDTPLQVNIGFKSDVEGVFERILRVYHLIDNTLYTVGDIVVNAEAIGEDERFRALIANFGLPDPKDIPQIFKETDINEDLPDWEFLNYKSKHMILEYDKIMPYVGTYKGLINAIKWLGYEDIYIREWFLNVKENKKLSFIVPFNAADRTQTILMFNADQRKVLKKLNQLTLVYCLTRESGEFDDWGTPITENCYPYNIKEIFIKLLGLKHWLERNIIGVNCRIVDITGEGIYFERVQNLIYATDNIGYDYTLSQSLTPYGIDKNSELVRGDASIRLTFLELTKTKLDDLNYRFIDMAECAWHPDDPSVYYSLEDPSYLADPSSFLLMGATFKYPFVNITDIMWRLSVEKDNAGVVGEELVTNPLFIYENDIRFYEIFDSSSIFHDASTNLTIYIERAYLRDASIDGWSNSLAYSIYPNYYIEIPASTSKILTKKDSYTIISGTGIIYNYSQDTSIDFNELINPYDFIVDTSVCVDVTTDTVIKTSQYGFIMESSLGNIVARFDDYVTFNPESSSLLQYAIDDNYKVPLLSFKNYSYTDASGITFDVSINKLYHLDILDGKIEMNAGILDSVNSSDNLMIYINWNYDTSLEEQMITVNAIYDSPRMLLFQIDPSIYYWADPSAMSGTSDPSVFIFDNSIYKMHVNHIGDYNIELFAWNSFNTMFYNPAKEQYPIWIKHPYLYTLIDNSSLMGYEASTHMSISEVSTLVNENLYPIYDRYFPLQELTFETDSAQNPYISVPSITYFQDVPEPGSINRFINMTERVLTISGTNITVDDDFQKFYTGDDVNLIKFDKGKYALIEEVSSYITTASGSEPTSITLDQIPVSFLIDSSTEIYILNNTHRTTLNASNGSGYLTLDISGYVFDDNQLVGVIVTNASTGYTWGASYRVTNVDGSTHSFDNVLPAFFVNNPNKYIIQAKHAFSTYAEYSIETKSATEVNNVFKVYLNDSYCHEYYLDNTFIYTNVLFDYDNINNLWYDPSLNLINSPFYYYSKYIDIDVSTFVILRAEYDPSNYMLNQKNIWTVRYAETDRVLFRVFNKSVPFIFDSSGYYRFIVESYDKYGNLIETE